jgi:hypothetical protein
MDREVGEASLTTTRTFWGVWARTPEATAKLRRIVPAVLLIAVLV